MKRALSVLFILIGLLSCKKEFPEYSGHILGHAGESLLPSKSKYPPNTLKSVKRALELGADGVEVDVRMTSDGVILAYHDAKLEDNSDGTGCINSKTYQEIQEVKVYNSDETIDLLEDILTEVLTQNKFIMLDVMHYNECSESHFDYQLFNTELNVILSQFTPQQKEHLVVNCTSPYMLNTLTDTVIQKSLEMDDPETSIPAAVNNDFEYVIFKSAIINSAVREEILNNNLNFGIFNIKTRKEINAALSLNPDFVISDNLPCTIQTVHGK